MQVKEVNGTAGTRSSFPNITHLFSDKVDWNINNINKGSDGNNYSLVGTINNVVLVKKIAQ